MRIVVTETAREHIAARGGILYVRNRTHRCCTGSLDLLTATTERPDDHDQFQSFAPSGLTLMLSTGGTYPEELVVDMRGRRPAAYWNGCAYRL